MHRAFAERFVEAQYAWTGMLLEHLIRCRRRLGDLDAVLVLGVLGLSALAAARHEPRREAPGIDADGVPRDAGINAQSIADVTGIPRQTVRRKLDALARAGLIARRPDGAWGLERDPAGGTNAMAELQDLTDGAVAGLGRLLGRLVVLAEATAAEPPR